MAELIFKPGSSHVHVLPAGGAALIKPWKNAQGGAPRDSHNGEPAAQGVPGGRGRVRVLLTPLFRSLPNLGTALRLQPNLWHQSQGFPGWLPTLWSASACINEPLLWLCFKAGPLFHGALNRLLLLPKLLLFQPHSRVWDWIAHPRPHWFSI